MTVPDDRSNAKVLRPERCVVLDGKPCAACTEDIKIEQEVRELEKTIEELQSRRRALRMVMNENHDHLIHKFPPEIASHIFIHYASPSVSHEGDRNIPLRLGSVCQKWRQLAWATPQLWSSIVIGPGRAPLELIAEWLERSASLPLTIRFYDVLGQHEGISALLNKHSARWYDIHLDIAPIYLPCFDGSSQRNMLHRLVLRSSTFSIIQHPDLAKFSMKSKPRPTDLTLLGVGLPWVDIIWSNLTVASVSRIDVGDCVELIRRAPLLQTLRMRNIDPIHHTSFPLPNTRIIHPHLHSLELSQINARNTFIRFLDSVSFPSLEKLSHESDILYARQMVSLIKGSYCLKIFKINIDAILVQEVSQLLSHLSTIELLELHSFQRGRSFRIVDLTDMLCDSGESPLFLPRMQSLEFVCEISGSFPWESLPQLFVPSRWRSLKVKVIVPDGWHDIEEESEHVVQELLDEGFDLSIADALQEHKWYY